MRMSDSFKLSLNSITHRKLRAWLTLLGIVIGVAAVVSIISIGEGANASISQQLSRFGADIITISPGFSRTGGFGGFAREGFSSGGGGQNRSATSTTSSTSSTTDPVLTSRDAMLIRANPNIIAVNETVSGSNTLIFLSEKINSRIQGVNPNYWAMTSDLNLVSGRLLSSSDSTAVVITTGLANNTFKQPVTLGRTLTIGGQGFTVVGILASSTSGFGGGDSTVYMNYTSAWNVTDVNKGNFSSIQAKAASTDVVTDTMTQLTQTLQLSRKVTSRNQDFSITSSQSIQSQVSSVTDTLTLFLGAIAAISLIVGAIGVANSMFTSVLEKTKEIGIMKALGSTDNEILTVFLFESALFGFVGGLIGAAVGTLGSFMLSFVGIIAIPGLGRGSTTLVTPQLLIIAILLSTIIGVISGIAPAKAASRLKPIEALRYE